jgi:hypothetical protein
MFVEDNFYLLLSTTYCLHFTTFRVLLTVSCLFPAVSYLLSTFCCLCSPCPCTWRTLPLSSPSATHSRSHPRTCVLPWCPSGVTIMLQWCYNGATVVLHWCQVPQWRYGGATLMLRWCYSGIPRTVDRTLEPACITVRVRRYRYMTLFSRTC